MSVEEEVLKLTMDNGSFLRAADDASRALGDIQKKGDFKNSGSSLMHLGKTINGLDLSSLANAIDTVNNRFSLLGIAGMSAINNIVTSAINAGTKIVKSLTIDPIKTGFQEYETQINAIQTILANTSKDNVGLPQVIAALDELNEYADLTIYNFTEMTKNIGTFTAAGVKLDVAVGAIKGIANLAAVSGSTSQQAATAMYQLSQALSSGTVKLQDWNSVVNAGMGGKVFQDALMETARVHGVAIDQMIKEEGSFRETLQKGWLTSKILTETLSKFTGDLNEEQLRAMGYTSEQIEGIVKMGKMANDAATKVKTITQLYDVLKEAVQSGWSVTSRLIFGDFDQAKELFTGISDFLGEIIGESSDARNNMLQLWSDLGGRKDLVKSLYNVMHFVRDLSELITEAFVDIIPPVTGEQLSAFTRGLVNLTEKLKMGDETVKKISRVVRGFASVIDIVIHGLKIYAAEIIRIAKLGLPFTNNILEFVAQGGDYLVTLRNMVKENRFFERSIEIIGSTLTFGINAILSFIENGKVMYATLSETDVFKTVSEFISGIIEDVKNFIPIVKTILPEIFSFLSSVLNGSAGEMKDLSKNTTSFFEAIREKLGPVGEIVVKVAKVFMQLGRIAAGMFSNLTGSILEMLSTIDVEKFLINLNLGSFAGLLIALQTFVGKGSGLLGIAGKAFTGFADGISTFGAIGKSFVETLDAVKNTLEAYQQSLKADILTKIAMAIGIIAASITVLSLIDPVRLRGSVVAISILLAELLGTTSLFSRMAATSDPRALISLTATLNSLAVSLLLFAGSIYILGRMDSDELARGLTAITVTLAVMTTYAKIFSKMSASLVTVAGGLTILSFAVVGFAASVMLLSRLDQDELKRGLMAVGVLLAEVSIFAKLTKVTPGSAAGFAGFILLSASLLIFAVSIEKLGSINEKKLGNALYAMGIILTQVSIFANVTKSTNALATSAGLIVIAGTILIFAEALSRIAEISWDGIARGLGAIGGLLLILGVAMSTFSPNMILNAGVLLVVSGALVLFSKALVSIGALSGEAIGRSLGAISAGLAVMVAVLYSMTGTIGGSAAMFIASAALVVFASALNSMSLVSWDTLLKGLVGMAGVLVILGISGALLGPLIPVILGISGAMFIFGVGIAAVGAGVFLMAVGLATLGAAIIAFSGGMAVGLAALLGTVPMVINIIRLTFIGLLNVVKDTLPLVVEAFTLIIASLIDSLILLAPKMGEVMTKVLAPMLQAIVDGTPWFVQAGFDMLRAFMVGIRDNVDLVGVGIDIVNGVLNEISSKASEIVTAGFLFIIRFLDAMTEGIEVHGPQLYESMKAFGLALVTFIGEGVMEASEFLIEGFITLGEAAIKAFNELFGINSPSEVFKGIAGFIIDGLILGLLGGVLKVIDNITEFAGKMIKAFSDMVVGFTAVGTSMIVAIGGGFTLGLPGLVVTAGVIISGVLTKIDTYNQDFVDRGESFVTRLRSGLNNQNGSFLVSVTNLITDALAQIDLYNTNFQNKGLAITSYISTGLTSGLKTISGSANSLINTILSAIEKRYDDIFARGMFITSTILAGISLESDELLEEISSLMDDVLVSITNMERDFFKSGSGVIESVQDGFVRGRVSFLVVVQDTIEAVITAFGGLVQASYTAGRLVAESFAKGITDNLNVVRLAAKLMASQVTNAIAEELDMHSPSTVLIGYGALGGTSFAGGIENSIPSVKSAVSKLARVVADVVSSIDTEIGEIRPVIRPVVDLDDLKKVKNEYATVLGLSSMSRVPSIAYSGSTGQTNIVREEKFEFNQTIQSTRPLSTGEIYRQTKNLLSMNKDLRSSQDD